MAGTMQGEGGGTPPRRFAAARTVRIRTPSGVVVEAAIAEAFVPRLLGLAWLDGDEAPPLLIPRCRSVHTFWMRFAIDVAFLAQPPNLAGPASVLDVRAELRPRRIAAAPRGGPPRGALRLAALELPAGDAARLGLVPGSGLECALADAAASDA